MIERYSREEMACLWTDSERFRSWLQVELAILDAQIDAGIIPKECRQAFKMKFKIDPIRISEIERETHHDVIAFCTSITEQMGEEGRFLHYGVTSSDVIDTGLSLQIQKASELIMTDIDAVLGTLKNLAEQHSSTVCIGRSHGIHAEYTSFGLKFLGAWSEFRRNKDRMQKAFGSLGTGMVSGPVGNYTTVGMEIEKQVCEKLNLIPEPVSTQVIPRDRIAEMFLSGALLAAAMERLAVELRHLQRTEVLEVEEGFTGKQKGSSAMPHKKNPISAENLTGCSRMLRSYASAALENIPLWHERDISHSSVERVFIPDFFILLDYSLNRLNSLLAKLTVKEENIDRNRRILRGLPHSGVILNEMVRKGISRENAYRIVQKAAHHCWEKGTEFRDSIESDSEFNSKFTKDEIEDLFSEKRYLESVPKIYERVFSEN